MQQRRNGTILRRSGFGNLPKSEKPDNKDSQKYRDRREVRRAEGAERRWRYQQRLERERHELARSFMT